MAQTLKRLQKELENFNKEDPEGFTAGPIDDADMYKWEATFPGPEDSPYKGGIFELRIEFQKDYPISRPNVEFITKIYHPSIRKDTGRNCFEFLWENWDLNRDIHIYELLLKIREALKTADESHIYEIDIWRQYSGDRLEFERIAREWTKKYAMDYTDSSEEASEEKKKFLLNFSITINSLLKYTEILMRNLEI